METPNNLTRRELRDQQRQERLQSAQQTFKSENPGWKRFALWAGVIGAFALIIFGLIKLGSKPIDQAKPLAVPISQTDWQQGKPDAKVTLVEYSDFQCPACAAYHPILKQLKTEMADKLLFVYRHFPLSQIHKNAQLAAQAAEAAGKQNKFWQMHDLLFEKQNDWAVLSSTDAKAKFIEYAQQIAIETNKFKIDLESDEVKGRVTMSYQGGIQSGVASTPAFFVNGQRIGNPQSYEQFKAGIEQLLNPLPVPSISTIE